MNLLDKIAKLKEEDLVAVNKYVDMRLGIVPEEVRLKGVADYNKRIDEAYSKRPADATHLCLVTLRWYKEWYSNWLIKKPLVKRLIRFL